MKFLILALLLVCSAARAQINPRDPEPRVPIPNGMTISGPASVNPGQGFDVTITANTQPWNGAQWTLDYSANMVQAPAAQPATSVFASKYPASTLNAHQVATVLRGADCPAGSPPQTCSGINNNPITNTGPIARVRFTAGQTTGPITFTLLSPFLVDMNGTDIPVGAGPAITVNVGTGSGPPGGGGSTAFCDLDKNGKVDGYDVFLQDSWVRKTSTPPAGTPVERTATSVPGGNIVDIQIVITASLGGICTATQ